MPSRRDSRKIWSSEEDRLLRELHRGNTIQDFSLLTDKPLTHAEHPDGSPPTNWKDIATTVLGRSNKDCRKRWMTLMSNDSKSKGMWTAEEDKALVDAVQEHGHK